MKRRVSALVLLVGLLLFSGFGIAQEDIPAGLVREDLQLISQESLPHWTPLWTGPVQAATVMAWFADHGYSALMSDFNGDGVIDELDTVELANDFGLGVMEAESLRGATDVRLVVGLARYVAIYYPDQFVLKIYDPSFSHEFTAQGFGVFEANAIPGIVLQLEGEPSISSYIYELATDEGVIIGLEEALDMNRYFSGRSYLVEETAAGYTPLDFAWAKEDAWLTGQQGQVLQTLGKMDNRFYLEFLNEWEPVEFMVALSPLDEEEPYETGDGCPDLTIRILDDSCVFNRKTMEYDIIVWAEVLNVGTEPVTSSFIVLLNSSTHPGSAVRFIPIPPLFFPGDTIPVALSFSLPPTVSGAPPCPVEYRLMVDAHEEIEECDEENNEAFGEVCCGEDEGECPDLIVEIIDVSCEFGPIPGVVPISQSVVTVEAKITNSGLGAVLIPTTALLDAAPPFDAFEATAPVPPLGPGDAHTVLLSFAIPGDEPPCPLDFVVVADANGDVDECDEHNNSAYDTTTDCCEDDTPTGACCFADDGVYCVSDMTAAECEEAGGTEFHPGVECVDVQCPPAEDDCPDLVVEILSAECVEIQREFDCTVIVEVTNIGGQTVTLPISLMLDYGCGNDFATIFDDLANGESAIVEFNYQYSAKDGCAGGLTVEVDYTNSIDECDENNNTG